MTVHLSLALNKQDLFCGEEVYGGVVITNSGTEEIQVPDPEHSRSFPLFHLVDVRTGAESLTKEAGGGREAFVALAPGRSVRASYPLTPWVPLGTPGEYELSVVMPYGRGLRRATSEAVRLRVHPVSPCRLALDTHQGLQSFGVWVDAESNPPRLVRARFHASGDPVSGIQPLSSTTLQAEPRLSLPPNQRDRRHHWVAWLERTVLKAIHFSPIQGVGPVIETDLASEDAVLAAPLVAEPPSGSSVRPAGAALLWSGGGGDRDGRLRIVNLTQGGATLGVGRNWNGPRPVWMATHTLSNGKRIASIVSQDEDRAILETLGWSRDSIGPSERRAEWKGTSLAAGATLTLKDVILGSLFLVREELPTSVYEVVEWELDRHGTFRERRRWPVRWEAEGLLKILVRVGPGGQTAVLLRDRKRRNFLAFSGAMRPLPPPCAETLYPLDVLFSGPFPILLLAEKGTGFRCVTPDGRVLPSSRA